MTTGNDFRCLTKMQEFTLRHNVQRHLGQPKDWIFWVSLVWRRDSCSQGNIMTFAVLINIIILSLSLRIIAIIISKDRKINLLDKLQLRWMHLCSLVKWLVIFFLPWTSNSIQTISDMFFRYSKMFSPINLRHNETFHFFSAFHLLLCFL